MNTTRKYIRIAIFLALLSILAVFLSALALTDIARGTEPLAMEWSVVQISAFMVTAFSLYALFLFRKWLRALS